VFFPGALHDTPCPGDVRHSPPQQPVRVQGDETGLVRPVLHKEVAGRGRRPVEERPIVGAETRVHRQVVAAAQHVHAVDLDDADPVDHLTQVVRGDRAGRARVGESLRSQCYVACLGKGQSRVAPRRGKRR